MAILDKAINRDGSGGVIGGVVRLVLRFFQFVLALTVAGLYGVDLQRADHADGKWVFAEVVAGLSAVTILLYAGLFFIPSQKLFPWDWILFILWTALFGLFGNMYIGEQPTPEQHGLQRMKNAVWVDLTNMLLWLITAVWGTVVFFLHRSGRTLHTGRAKV
ncbi:hypothetical protein TI39_contig429g00011 [Zymoseptoria brevis]|uniref:MARVEL domain-containing protein n=1 Tax=Zymoseptoria brevis TaxID=1047168 RepID=A0A0F4GLA6_9PEZI|nr:hypothetical protein TI39_contig429g00011 [Zymoseptoria brevis]